MATGQMHEKYNATVIGGVGAGGEYTPQVVQVGFGWTNGAVLDLLQQHGQSITLVST
jgi:alpha,alpha-trehalase